MLLFILFVDDDVLAVSGDLQRTTLIFNAFVFMQIFNEINSRKVGLGELNPMYSEVKASFDPSALQK